MGEADTPAGQVPHDLVRSGCDRVVSQDLLPEASRHPPGRSLGPSFGLIALLLGTLWFAGLGERWLLNPDEGRYAEIPREMLATGDWVTPRLNGIKYFEKPPLQYWATAATYAAFGLGQGAARLWPALLGVIGVLSMYRATLRLWGSPTAVATALILASSFLFIVAGHVLTLDMGTTGWLTVSLAAFLLAQQDQAKPGERRQWMYVVWFGMALAVLSKGLIGLVLPVGTLAIYMVWQRDWGLLHRLHLLWGLAILLAVCAPWFLLVSQRNPEFAQFFFVHEHFQRFTSEVHHRPGPWWYFLPVLVAGLLPWTGFLPGAVAAALWPQPGYFQPARLLLVWAGFILLFFSLSSSKLPFYILPVLPALAPLLAMQALCVDTRRLARQAAVTALLGVAVAAGGLALVLNLVPGDILAGEPRQLGEWVILGGVALALAAGVGAAAASRGNRMLALLSLSVGMLLAVQVGALTHNAGLQGFSGHDLAEVIRPRLRPATEIYALRHYDQSLPFYLRRTVVLVDYRDEFAPGLDREPRHNSASFDDLVDRWRAGRPLLVLTDRRGRAALEQSGLDSQVLYEDSKRYLLMPVGQGATP